MHLIAGLFNAIYFVVGILIPGYKSFKSIESDDIQSHQRWIAYWIVWSLLSVVSLLERLFRPSLLYLTSKLGLLVWLANDRYRGSLVLYNGLLRPLLVSYASWIDSFFSHGTVIATKTSQRLLEQMREKTKQSTHNLRMMTSNLVKKGTDLVQEPKRPETEEPSNATE